jgi:hypothetical protein
MSAHLPAPLAATLRDALGSLCGLWAGAFPLRRSRRSHASAVIRGSNSRRFPERGGERVRTAEANRQTDFRYRTCAVCQQYLGVLNTTVGLVSMWRHSERLLEHPAEMIRAQTNELRQRANRYLLIEMFLDIGSGESLLPRCKATLELRLNTGHPTSETRDFVYEQSTETPEVDRVSCRAIDERLQLERSVP